MGVRVKTRRPSGPDAAARQPVAGRLLSTAAEMFWRQGYAGTSTRQLSRELGLQKASLYYHMGKKEDLLYEICVDSLRNIHATALRSVDRAQHPRERVGELIRGHVAAMLKDRDKHATMLTELRSLLPERRDAVVAMRDEYEGFVRSVIADAQRAGELRDDLSAKMLTLGLLDLVNGSVFWFREDGALSADELADVFAALFLDGARPRGAAST